ncbi:MAG: hypothetical protein SPL73_08140 [Cyanobacteriota bacterium]|nr:hypothetical protein [Cyanobacteriota bacterium]MDY6364840.1 hypothetical protein [Cyanobacteriota bacterium]
MNKETLTKIATNLLNAIQPILEITLPYLAELVKSKVVPYLKRKAYEKADVKANQLIKDLAQNAGKIKDETDPHKKEAYTEGTKLGIETIRAIADKLNKAADEIEKAALAGV